MKYASQETDLLFEAILSLKDKEECYKFFDDVCTVKEILDIAQRFAVAKMLNDKKSYQAIAKETGMSTATICRVNRCLLYGGGGYQMAIDRVKESNGEKNEN